MNLISENQLQQWNQAGFLKVAGFLPDPLRIELPQWVDEIASRPESDDQWMHHFEQTVHGPRLARTEHIVESHEGMRQLLTQGLIPDTAGELLGEPVVLYKEKINYKYPGGAGYAAHQDAPAYDHVKLNITCLIAVDEATPENGCLFFASGLHRQGLLPMDDVRCIDFAVAEKLEWKPLSMQPGDVLFFSSYAPHYSPANQTEKPRRSLYLTYNAISEGDLREEYYRDKRRVFSQAGETGNPHVRISTIGHFQGNPVEKS